MNAPADELRTAVIIEDDPEIRRILSQVLEAAGFATVSAENGLDGVRAVAAHQPLLTTLDVSMPGIDGFEAARRIRAQSDTYIIMLTALSDEADVVAGLGAGADDYLLKPFRPRELRARIDAALRRTGVRPLQGGAVSPAPTSGTGPSSAAGRPGAARAPVAPAGAASGPSPTRPGDADDEWLVHRDIRLHPEQRVVKRDGEELDLTRTEFDLLATLLESKRRVRSKADLTLVLRGESFASGYYVGEADRRAVEAHMTNLRRKLGDSASSPRYIETVRGVGYRLTSES
ncbi:response regulator transcription factor [Microbacterium sp.]|uniref:response regulator transcription factor n=1 Tax=Microbacterium sp. TaxID=51671 RepID=UPI002BE7AA43|nr:response regulator transcription factor [Microbacterium sp.]HWL77077.1 response regulator transcription factor [Microbacterium sp.]